jgi:integrase
VPLHPALAGLVARRLADKEPEAFLLEELKAPAGRPERRGQKVGERFTTYRRDLGLDERDEGRRQANADFHSFRRWHITKLEQAGIAPHLIAALVGHEEGRDFLALIRYSAGPSSIQLVEALERVQLPQDARTESPEGRLLGRTGGSQGR